MKVTVETGPPLAASWKFAPVNVTEQPGAGLLGKVPEIVGVSAYAGIAVSARISPTPNTGAAMRISFLRFGNLKASSSPSGMVHRTIRSPPTVGKPCSASTLPIETLP